MRTYKNYKVKEDFFKRWSPDMAYVLGFIVADGCLRRDGYYVKVEVSPKDIAVLEFISNQITPGYDLKFTDRGTEVRWYPSSKILKNDLMAHGVMPAKTGREVVPPTLTKKYYWDFLRGYFDGDGGVETCGISITCNSGSFLNDLRSRFPVGYIRKDRMNFRWVIEKLEDLKEFHNNMYSSGSFFFKRKKSLFDYLVSTPPNSGRFTKEEDCFLLKNYESMTRLEMAMAIGRKSHSVKNRMRKLKIRKGGVSFVV